MKRALILPLLYTFNIHFLTWFDVDAEELERRRAAWVPAPPVEGERGYRKLFVEHVNQAGQGVDFDFLTNRPFTAKTP